MLFLFECPNCRTPIEAAGDVSGRQSHCPRCRGPYVVPAPRVDCGTTLGGFRLERRLGKGGMGEVFLGTQLSVDRQVAVKVLPTDFAANRDAVERFLHEGRLAARLDHATIVTVHEAGEDSGHYYLAMAYVEGESLDQRLKRDGPLPEREALAIIRAIAEALGYAWDEVRLLHRDLKPANIMLDRRGRVFLMDLGLAKTLGEETCMTLSGTILGTPQYMSPEQAMGSSRLSVQTDIYALGATLYHLVVGAPPFTGDSAMQVLTQHLHAPLPPPRSRNPRVSEACSALIGAMMAKAPEDRAPGWGALTAEIDRVLAATATAADGAAGAGTARTTARAAVAAPRGAAEEGAGAPSDAALWARLRRRPWVTAALAGAALLVALAGALALPSRGGDGQAGWGSQTSQTSQTGRTAGVAATLTAPVAGAGPAPGPAAPAPGPGAGAVGTVLRVPAGFRTVLNSTPEPYTDTGWAHEIVHDATGMVMVYIPAGSFTMGSPDTEAERDDDERQHRVTLTRGFYLGKYEVTQDQWQRVMGENPSRFADAGRNTPVERVSWEDGQAFCRKLGEGFRLPTEAEWEYAARGGPVSRGFTYSGSDHVADVGWFNGNSGIRTIDVGQRRANELGLHDMSGNVFEWCQDGDGDYPSGAVIDPVDRGTGPERIFRGGAWNGNARNCRCANRARSVPTMRGGDLGLRLVRTAP